jgi:hypothetical protein
VLDRHDRLCPLADSLPGAIRWRFSDYGQLLAKQLKMLAPPLTLVWPPRADRPAIDERQASGFVVQRQWGRGCEPPSAAESPPPLPPGAE